MKSFPYQVLGTNEREESLFFILDSLLRSRIETGEETIDDEDVNIYLAGLLHSFLDQSFYRTYGDTITRYDSQIYDLAEVPGDPGVRFRVYKGNADFALMAAGVFEKKGQTLLRDRIDLSRADLQEEDRRGDRPGEAFRAVRDLQKNTLIYARRISETVERIHQRGDVSPRAGCPRRRAHRLCTRWTKSFSGCLLGLDEDGFSG